MMRKLALGLLIVLATVSCEKDYGKAPNHMYDFSAKLSVDQWGIETWGGHNFILDEKIENIEQFKECYVNYMAREWDLPVAKEYKKAFYQDHKNVKIRYMGKSYVMYTNKTVDLCQ